MVGWKTQCEKINPTPTSRWCAINKGIQLTLIANIAQSTNENNNSLEEKHVFSIALCD